MFLNRLLKDNKEFVDVALSEYSKGEILPDSYLIDLDTLMENAKKILNEAKKHNIKLYYMLKQIGRNPYIAKKLEELGYSGSVCVDFKEVEVMMENGLKLGNVGHLVQIPKNFLEKVISYGCDIITVYSIEMIEEISKISKKLGKVQDIMLRVLEKDSSIYPGQEAGFSLDSIKEILPRIKELEAVRLSGLTSFPCFLYSDETKKIEVTNNLFSVLDAKKMLEDEGIEIQHVNLPSVTTVENIPLIAKYGGTHAEPGHALTGTAPFNKEYGDEVPAYLYISEISHNFNDKSYFYGGGYYSRGNMKNAYIDNRVVEVEKFCSDNIDYYLSMKGKYDVFTPIILCFRTQIFVTRSDVIIIEGIKSGKPQVVKRYSAQGLERRM
ncbi:alanine racemase [Streptobacillus felis]|uniref:Alanine racemase n=1 Tax=Streptobacillus felis TaxID=1384509 RepID=A0A7Z0PES1_9FUSO|nr:alanine racemase [Streptobacillus felis]NYV27837.1 alanine racemase [Streptobacillus felis]